MDFDHQSSSIGRVRSDPEGFNHFFSGENHSLDIRTSPSQEVFGCLGTQPVSVHNLRIASGIACTFIRVLFQRSWGLFYDEFSSCVYTPEN